MAREEGVHPRFPCLRLDYEAALLLGWSQVMLESGVSRLPKVSTSDELLRSEAMAGGPYPLVL
jgi:hypothetical protein